MTLKKNCLKHQERTGRIIGVFLTSTTIWAMGFWSRCMSKPSTWHCGNPASRFIGKCLERAFSQSRGRAFSDLVVGGAVLVEAKACQCLHAAHKAQALNYLRATALEVALLLNFGPSPGVKRLVFDNHLKTRIAGRAVEDPKPLTWIDPSASE